jgi:hypothetical protein
MTTSPASSTSVVPRFVNIAYYLFLLTAAVHLVSLIISIATFGSTSADAKSKIASSGSGISSSQANGLLGASLAVAVVFGVLFLVAFVLFDVFMRRGANWARIVLLVLTVLSLTGIASQYGLGALGVVAAIVATILMFLTPSNAYFRETKARKLGSRAGYQA